MKALTCRLVLLGAVVAGAEVWAQNSPITLSYDFRNGAQGWSAVFADYPAGQEAFYELAAGIAPLPPELGTPGTSFRITGNNHSDDLLMALTRKVGKSEGLVEGRTYWLDYTVEFASNAQNGCVGTGGAPGESVWIKVGGWPMEPKAYQEPGDVYRRLSVNIGNQAQPGPAASVAGNVANGVPCGSEPKRFRVVTRTKRHTFPVTASEAGDLWLLVSSDSGYESTTELHYLRVSVTLTPVETGGSTRLVNLSARAMAGSGASALFGGLVVGGNGPRTLLVRGAGPALGEFGVSGFLPDPVLEVRGTGQVTATNDNWNDAANLPELREAVTRTGAFVFPNGSKDAAILATVEPGVYTATLRDAGNGSGVALLEVYDASDAAAGGPRLVNLSARARVGSGEAALFPGLVVSGPNPEKLLIRAVGPGLGEFGVSDFLPDPTLRLAAGAEILAENDNWDRTPEGALIESAGVKVGAFALRPASKDAALLVTLAPGTYTLQVSDVSSRSGTAIVEVYRVP